MLLSMVPTASSILPPAPDCNQRDMRHDDERRGPGLPPNSRRCRQSTDEWRATADQDGNDGWHAKTLPPMLNCAVMVAAAQSMRCGSAGSVTGRVIDGGLAPWRNSRHADMTRSSRTTGLPA